VTESARAYDRGDDVVSIEAANKAIALNPKNARAFFRRGLARSRKKEWRAALADYEKTVKLDPSRDLTLLIETTKALVETAQATTPTPSPERPRVKTKRKG